MTTKSNGGHNEINVRRHERDKEETRRNRARAMMQEAWRKDGRERRRILLEEDELTGGSDFHINHECPLRNYCAIADRVSQIKSVMVVNVSLVYSFDAERHSCNFNAYRCILTERQPYPKHFFITHLYKHSLTLTMTTMTMTMLHITSQVREQFQQAYKQKTKLDETYIMGNRLIKFLSQVLPTHPHYLSKRPDCTRQRVKIQHDLRTVREQVEEVALLLDKNFYRGLMEAQGLEFDVPSSPSRKNEERVRKVRFNLELERIEYDPHLDQNDQENDEGVADFENTDVTGGDVSDLAVWEDRDPEADLSFSSEGSSFDNFFGSDAVTDTELNGNENSFGSFDFESDDNAFSGGFDESWEHFASNDQRDAERDTMLTMWPEITEHFDRLGIKDSNASDENNMTEETEEMENVSNDTANELSFVDEADNGDVDDDNTSSSSDEDYDEYDISIEDNDKSNISFVEKIARENFYRGIDELGGDDDDDSAQDSWAQDEEEFSSENLIAPDHDVASEDPLQMSVASDEDGNESLFMDKISEAFSDVDPESSFESLAEDSDRVHVSFDSQVKYDEAESSIDGHNERNNKVAKVPRAANILKPIEDESQTIDSLEYSSAPSEWDGSEFNISDSGMDLTDLHEDFNNSQIIAESPDEFNFDHVIERVDTNDDDEHDDYIHKMTKLEFSDQNGEVSACDSSGGGKTITTTSTEETFPMTAEDLGSDDSSSSSCEHEDASERDKGNVLGIVRRDTYIPTIDSPQKLKKKQFGDELDYLELKVKDLQEKMEYDINTVESEYPIQMSREPVIDVDANIVEGNNNTRHQGCVPQSEAFIVHGPPTVKKIHPNAAGSDIPDKEEQTNSKQPELTVPRRRRHPTAARLKALRQSTAWKRRYSKTSKD